MGSGSRTAAAVGGAEGLVEVQVHHVEAQVSQLGAPQEGVHIGAVAVDDPARFVDEPAHLQDVGIEQSQCAGQRQHDARQLRARGLSQRLDVRVAARVRRQRHDLEARHGRRGGVRPVGAVGDEHLAPRGVASGEMVSPRHQHPGQLAVGSGHGRQAYVRQPGDLGEVVLEPVHQPQRALHRGVGLMRVYLGHPRQGGHLVAYLGVVLHRTAPQGVEVGIDGEVELAELGEVADQLRLADLGVVQVVPEELCRGQLLFGHVQGRQRRPHPAGGAALHQQSAAVFAEGVEHRGHGPPPISASASASDSISSRELISVTQRSIPLGTDELTSRPPMIR